MDFVISEIVILILIFLIPISIVLGIYFIINNWVKKSNAIKKENNLLLREMIELLKNKQGD